MMTMIPEAEKAMKIDDLYLGAYLACEGLFPTGVDSIGGGRRWFVYDHDQQGRIRELMDKFYAEDVTVRMPFFRARVKEMGELIRHGR